MIKHNQFYTLFVIIIICFGTDSVLSAAITASRNDVEIMKVGEQTNVEDALQSQQVKDSENVAPIDPVLCKVPVNIRRNVDEERVAIDFQRNLREGKAPLLAVFTMPNGAGAIPVIVLRQNDNTNNNKNPFQAIADSVMSALGVQPSTGSDSSSSSNNPLQFFQNLFPGPIVNPTTSNDEQPNQAPDVLAQLSSQFQNLQTQFSTSVTNAITNFQTAVSQAVGQAAQTLNSVVSNNVNSIQTSNENLLSNLFATPSTTTTTTAAPENSNETSTSSSTENMSTSSASTEVPKEEEEMASVSDDEPESNDLLVEKVGEDTMTSTTEIVTKMTSTTTATVSTSQVEMDSSTTTTTTVAPMEEA